MKTLKGAIVELSGGNVRNHHFYLHGMPWIPAEVIGGKNETEQASELLSVEFSTGTVIDTDIAGDKIILRKRSAVREFFIEIDAHEGTRLLIEHTGPRSIRVEPR